MRNGNFNNYYSGVNHNSNDLSAVIRIIVSFFVIVISTVIIYVVIKHVMDIKIFGTINLKEEAHDSLSITTDANSGTSFFVQDEKGLKFRKEDKTFARDEWIEKNGELFYFDTAGYGLNTDLKMEGQLYKFENGKLKNIKRDTSYVSRAKDELFSSVESAQYLVWLKDDEKNGNFYPIKYKQFSDDNEDYLGTEYDKQYSSPNMIKINMSNIYYLAIGKGTNFANRLYRMRPNAIHRETVGVGVTGYIVLSDDVVYYCDGERVIKAKSWKSEMLTLPENEELNEEGEIVEKISTSSIVKMPIINDQGKPLSVDVSNLPIPDPEVKIIETNINDMVNDKKNDKNNEKVEIGIAPFELNRERTSAVKEEKVEVGEGPKVVEVEAPR